MFMYVFVARVKEVSVTLCGLSSLILPFVVTFHVLE